MRLVQVVGGVVRQGFIVDEVPAVPGRGWATFIGADQLEGSPGRRVRYIAHIGHLVAVVGDPNFQFLILNRLLIWGRLRRERSKSCPGCVERQEEVPVFVVFVSAHFKLLI